jgi:hypothetical protein
MEEEWWQEGFGRMPECLCLLDGVVLQEVIETDMSADQSLVGREVGE